MIIVGMQGIKPHFCSNIFLAQQVEDNLVSRYGKSCVTKEVDKSPRFIWNPGGSSYGNTIFEFELAGLTLGCYASHWGLFKTRVLSQASVKYGGKTLL